jgi:hypothetical protein
MVVREHSKWMLALGECVSPHRTQRLAEMVPLKYPLTARIQGQYPDLVKHMEHLEPSGHEFSLPVNFVTLPLLLSDEQLKSHRRRVLIDAGAGGAFHSGTKALLDMYNERARFDEVILIEPAAHRLEWWPEFNGTYNMSVWTSKLAVGTRDRDTDLLVMLDKVFKVSQEDFVVLKFDCDVGSGEASMEWGFMADLVLHAEYLALVDEIFIEMHYYHPSLWADSFITHTMWQV